MSFYYNEAFENPDYHSSETLVVDRTRPSLSSTFPQHNPYDSYEEYGVEGRQGQIPPGEIPMQSMWTQSDAEYSPRDLAFRIPHSNPYGNAQINPSFEYEPEFAQTLPTARSALNDDYAHRPFDADDGDSSQPQLHPGYNEDRKKDEKLINDLAVMSTRERIKTIKKIPKPMREKREIRNNAIKERTRKSRRHDAQMNSCAQCFYNTALLYHIPFSLQ
ncbi:transmembrane channel-like protein 5 isoform X2 [Varanus komodoensis]|uniref:transmembrane channel-like protein 5 isoform X2 n=1 Tax=Varanus komodoensis TaxID=61221 RepID=UPI001CF7A9B6|nr:transmembrane channel-like protein 5 isoform X2 [Varanus komodoensis]